jgi:GntR family transcriptional regulator
VSRNLVRQALVGLVAEGQVVARQGYGYRVNSRRIRRELPILTGYTAGMKTIDPTSRVEVIRQELTANAPDFAKRLTGQRASKVVLVERVAHLFQQPAALLTDYFHPDLAEAILPADLDDRPLYASVERKTGVRGVRAPTVLSVDFAGANESTLLKVADGSPLIRLDISTYAEDDYLFSCSIARFRSDRFEFTLEKAAP